MAAHPQNATVSLDDFFDELERSEERLEFVDGHVLAMGGTSDYHSEIVVSITTALRQALRGRGCHIGGQGPFVIPPGSENVFSPDVYVYCGERRVDAFRGITVIREPTVLVEVLSPSTTDYDRGTKWDNYSRIPSLQACLLVRQDAPQVTRYTRHGDGFWLFSQIEGWDAEVAVDALGVSLRLADIYDGVLALADGASA